ncbi:MAG TPA: tRNA (adenosine(37)-N6)-dimethylallyltransferase MiaA [Beijerinckiaceae bacterium]|nr:tRNA (adenosine(37)-N6)-dimethylallyltransferase MiaA [Beijerinckiaceae bacterium]
MISALLIAGPTASGKSALALACAERRRATIVNADSMQVYRDLRILTARPSAEEEIRVPHCLYGTVDAAENFSVGRWLSAANATIETARQAESLPIFAGGTGLYFKALLHGLSEIPSVPADIRARVRAGASALPTEDLHARLAAVDPSTAALLRPSDRQRVLRALEVFEATQRPLIDFHGRRNAPLLDAARCLCIFLAPDRALLNAGIDRRFEGMIEAGALEEVRRLAERHLDPALPAMRAHGVPHLLRHLAGELPLAEAVRLGQLDTRHYAKRQFTFFRHQLPEFRWVAPAEAQSIVEDVLISQT